jgi:23S rRNA (uracil1939-C5)-methyltransferase
VADTPLAVLRLGAEGDGVAAGEDGKPRYLPFTLPGEIVHPGDPPEVLRPSPERIAPPCPHFGTCGGCALQHWRDDAYAAWKRGLLTEALRRAGYEDAPVADLQRTPPAVRRRIDLAIRRRGAALLLGLHRRGHGDVIDLAACPVLHPALAALLPPLRGLLRSLAALRREGAVVLNLLDSGPDLLLRLDAMPDAGDRARIAAFAAAHNLPRIAIAAGKAAPEIASQRERPSLRFDGAAVTPPPGAFLQASSAGEAAIRAGVSPACPTS